MKRLAKKEGSERSDAAAILAEELGRQRGWVRAMTPFSLIQLSRRTDSRSSRRLGGQNLTAGILPGNAVYYREPGRSHRPAGIAVHLYGWPEIGPDVELMCMSIGLRYETVAFPGWIPQAQLVIYTPAQPGKAVMQKQKREVKGEPCEQLNLPYK